MSQLQSFEFLSNIKSLELPKERAEKAEFLSEEDATAWAKEADAAGINREPEDQGNDTSERAIETEKEAAILSNREERREDSLLTIGEDEAFSGASVGMKIGDDLWTFQVVEDTQSVHDFQTTEDSLDQQSHLDFEPKTNPTAEKPVENAQTEIEAASTEVAEEELIENEPVDNADEVEGAETATEENIGPETYSFGVREQATNTAAEPAKETRSAADEKLGQILKSVTTGDSSEESDFESNADELAYEDFSFMEELEQSANTSVDVERPSNDNHEASLSHSRGTSSVTNLTTSKGPARMSAAFSAMQARAEALAAQESFTLRGGEFGGKMDIRMRPTLDGLDLTLMPELASQANRLNDSLKTIKTMLNDRGVGTRNVRLNTENVADPFEEQHNRFQDTALFTQSSGVNDNRVNEITGVRHQMRAPLDTNNEGDIA
jgi:hypothetical protein